MTLKEAFLGFFDLSSVNDMPAAALGHDTLFSFEDWSIKQGDAGVEGRCP